MKKEQEEDDKDEGEEHEEWEEEEVRAGIASARLKVLILGGDPDDKTCIYRNCVNKKLEEERNTRIVLMMQAVEKRNSGVRAWKKALSLQRMRERQGRAKQTEGDAAEEESGFFANKSVVRYI